MGAEGRGQRGLGMVLSPLMGSAGEAWIMEAELWRQTWPSTIFQGKLPECADGSQVGSDGERRVKGEVYIFAFGGRNDDAVIS